LGKTPFHVRNVMPSRPAPVSWLRGHMRSHYC
jgi:hypothetical protein